jgi:polyisoprenoid-binding protein YceI
MALSILLLGSPILARATEWQIDPAHSSVQFSVRHMMISNVRGEFTKTTGTITAEGKDPNSVKIQAEIDAGSISTRVEKRDAHLKSADFLDVEKYPTIIFDSKKIEAAGAGKWKVTGDLTLHGVTREVVLDVTGPTEEITDPMGKKRVAASATTAISRKDFGVNWNKALEAGGLVVGDEVKIQIDVEATQKSPAAAAADRQKRGS